MTAEVNLTTIRAAAARISDYLHVTPVLTSLTINTLSNKKIYFKAENLQKTGSFKARGALNASACLLEKSGNKPRLVTHSSGNHGTALAWAAHTLGMPCTVVVPEGSPEIKCRAIRAYGADLVFCKQTPKAREEAAQAIIQERGNI
jgi:threonine dehydratase